MFCPHDENYVDLIISIVLRNRVTTDICMHLHYTLSTFHLTFWAQKYQQQLHYSNSITLFLLDQLNNIWFKTHCLMKPYIWNNSHMKLKINYENYVCVYTYYLFIWLTFQMYNFIWLRCNTVVTLIFLKKANKNMSFHLPCGYSLTW